MGSEFLRNLRLAIAVMLVCVWAMGSLCAIPVLDNANFLLGIAPVVQYTSAQWNQRIVWRHREGVIAILAVGALIAGAFLLSKWIPEEEGRAFMHSPPVVLAIWLLVTLAMVRQATEIARAAALADQHAAETASSRDELRRNPSRLTR